MRNKNSFVISTSAIVCTCFCIVLNNQHKMTLQIQRLKQMLSKMSIYCTHEHTHIHTYAQTRVSVKWLVVSVLPDFIS